MAVKKRKSQNEVQYQPFNDFIGMTTEEHPKTFPDQVPSLEEWAEASKSAEPRHSESLHILMKLYREAIKTEGEDKALTVFWIHAAKLCDGGKGYLSTDQWNLLQDAFKGNISSCKLLVRSCPDTIHLPFVADAMAGLVRAVKAASIGKGEVQRIKDEWADFLPRRQGGDIPYDPEILEALLQKAREEGSSGRFGHKAQASKEYAAGIVADLLGISDESVLKKTVKKTTRGRPKKQQK